MAQTALERLTAQAKASRGGTALERLTALAKGGEPTFGEQVQGFASEVGRGAVRGLAQGIDVMRRIGEGAATTFAPADSPPDPVADAEERAKGNARLNARIDAMFPIPESVQAQEPGFVSALGQGLGSTIQAGVTMAASPAAGTAMIIGAGVLEGHDDAKAAGADDATAWTAGLLNAPGAALDVIPGGAVARLAHLGRAGRALAKADKASGGAFTKFFKSRWSTPVIEGATEGAQDVWKNLVDKFTYDKDRELLKGAPMSALVGTIVGGGAAVAERIVDGPERTEEPPPTETPQPGTVPTQPSLDPSTGETAAATTPITDQAPSSDTVPLQTGLDVGGAAVPASTAGADVVPDVATAPAQAAPAATLAPPLDPNDPRTTGIKNATVDAELAAMGFDPALHGDTTTFAAEFDEAGRTIRANPRAGADLIDTLDQTVRAPNEQETALLVHEVNRLINEKEAAEDAYNANQTKETAKRYDRAKEDYQRAANVVTRAGTESGKSLAFRRMMIRRDYSRVAMERAKGVPLSAEEIAHDNALRAKLEAIEKEYADYRVEQEKALAAKDVELAHARLQQQAKGPIKTAQRKAANAQSKAKIDDLIKQLVAKAGTARTIGALDAETLSIVTKLAAEHLKIGIRNVAEFTDTLVSKVGEHMRPYVDAAWKAARESHVISLAEPIDARMSDGQPLANLTSYVHKIALEFTRQGVTDREELIDRVHEVLQAANPKITRDETMHAISGYGKTSPLDKEPAKVTLRDLKGQMQQLGKLQDLLAGQPPKKTGVERRKPSDAERRFIKQVNALKKELGLSTTDPDTQLASALDAIKTRLTNQINDLQHEIDTGQRIVKGEAVPPSDAEVEVLKAQRDELKTQRDSIFPNEGQEAALKQRIDDVIARIQKGETEAKAAAEKAVTPEVKALRAQLGQLNQQLAEMRNDKARVERLKNKPDPQEKALRKRIDAVKARLEAKDTSTRGKKATADTAAVAELKAELAPLQEQLDALRKGPPPTEAETQARQVALATKAVEKSIARIEEQIKSGNLAAEKAQAGPTTPALEALRARREALSKELAALRLFSTPYDFAGREQRKLAGAAKAMETRLANEIARTQQRLTFEDFGPPTKKAALPLTPKAIQLKTQAEEMRRILAQRKLRYERENRSRPQKILDAAAEALRLPKAIWSAFDVSAVGRHGAFFSGPDLFFRPAQFTRRVVRMFKALKSDEYSRRVETEIGEDPAYQVLKRAGVQFTGVDGLSPREELFQSEMSNKIPGIAMSNRAFTTYLNLLRLDHGKRLLRATNGTPAEAHAVAQIVNAGTGRGNAGHGKFARTLDASGTVLWAPSLYLSRFQLLFGQPLYGGTARTRLIAAREYGTALAALAAVYSLAGLYNLTVKDDEDKAKIGTDPFESDIGKIIIGNTRIDPLAGLSQVTRVVSRLGRIVWRNLRGEKAEEEAVKVAIDFARTKVSPSIGVPYSLITGKDVAFGREKPRSETLKELAIPLSFRDVKAVMEEQGVPAGTALWILSAFGMGLQNYGGRADSEKALYETNRAKLHVAKDREANGEALNRTDRLYLSAQGLVSEGEARIRNLKKNKQPEEEIEKVRVEINAKIDMLRKEQK
jgi:hypothetical protein